MRIVVDFSSHQYRLTPNEIFFLDKCFQLLTKEQSEHEWIPEPFSKTKGVISLLPLGIKKSIVLDRIKPQLLITTGEVLKNSQGSKQIFFFQQAYEKSIQQRRLLVYPSLIITASSSLRKKIVQDLSDENRVVTIPAAPSEDISVADWSEKLSVKEKYADGREFFFCFKQIGQDTRWEEILKAFSIFKRWQQSSFRLVIAGEIQQGYQDLFNEKFGSYKYRSDVRIIDPRTEDVDRILPSAFGMICADPDYTGIGMLNGFKVEVPVISSPVDIFDDEVSGAFLPAIPEADELSRQLINLYRDEQMRDVLIQKGKDIVARYSWENTVQAWSTCIKSYA
jgi:glycosyltransferase involved in cell wall biosynthesis